MPLRLWVLTLLLGWSLLAQAEDPRRLQFVEALGKIESGQGEAEDYPGLRDYVLYPYLESAALLRALRSTSGDYTDSRVQAFLVRHAEAPYTRTLRITWLRQLAGRDRWSLLIEHYPRQSSEEIDCLAAQAKIALKQADARVVAESLWLTGDMRHKACVPVFDWLETSGLMTQALIEGRVRLAMEQGNLRLVQSLLRKQTGVARKRSEHWEWAWRNPRDAIGKVADGGDARMDAEMFEQVFRRLALVDRGRAAALYDAAMRHAPVSAMQKQQLAAYLGFRLILNREPEALAWYRRSGNTALRPIENDWRLRAAIYAEAWADVLNWIAALPPESQAEPRWQYWKGRALTATGRFAEGQGVWRGIAGLRDYYGFLAADRLNTRYGIVDLPVQKVPAVQAALQARADTQRAFELWKAGLKDKARSEWAALLDTLDKGERLQAGILADDWGWWPMAITSYGKAGYWDDLGRRFPAPHRTLFSQETRRQGIPLTWAYAITRAESMFAHDARSPVGALGLMQLMPATAKQVARSENLRWQGTAMLYEESRNVRLGVRYLADLREKYAGHLAMATAAYNAGPGNVNKWRPARELPADIWIEAVPFGATHNYLRHVLEYMATYEWRLTGEQPTRLSALLSPVKAR